MIPSPPEPQPSEPMEIGGGGLVAFCAVVSTATVVVFLFLMLSGCTIDDPRYNRGATPAPCMDGHTPTIKKPCKNIP